MIVVCILLNFTGTHTIRKFPSHIDVPDDEEFFEYQDEMREEPKRKRDTDLKEVLTNLIENLLDPSKAKEENEKAQDESCATKEDNNGTILDKVKSTLKGVFKPGSAEDENHDGDDDDDGEIANIHGKKAEDSGKSTKNSTTTTTMRPTTESVAAKFSENDVIFLKKLLHCLQKSEAKSPEIVSSVRNVTEQPEEKFILKCDPILLNETTAGVPFNVNCKLISHTHATD